MNVLSDFYNFKDKVESKEELRDLYECKEDFYMYVNGNGEKYEK